MLIHHHGGGWKATEDSSAPTGWIPVIEVCGTDHQLHQVQPVQLVHEHLHPVPQRIPRLIEQAVALAGHGPATQHS
ncbi:hypothetical protein P8605_44510 [Streptomyces sp. T-3]|nr:hypothetical protein [Streptomyces sp. T-3]